jgi:hypothetical protein
LNKNYRFYLCLANIAARYGPVWQPMGAAAPAVGIEAAMELTVFLLNLA